MVNISGKPLSVAANSLLSKGLNYCPTQTQMKRQQFFEEVDNFKRNISLKVFFNKEKEVSNTPQNNGSEKRNTTINKEKEVNTPKNIQKEVTDTPKNTEIYKSTILERLFRKQNDKPFQPPHQSCVSAYADAIKDEIETAQPQRTKMNLTREEQRALRELTTRDDIVIKKADKGGATVVVSSEWYEGEAKRQLDDTAYYKKVDEDNTKRHEEIIKHALTDLVENQHLDKKLAHKLTPTNSKTPEFYLLPKIHKSPVTGRPVISSTGCHTEKISAYVDEFLKPAAQELPSYIKDSYDFSKKINSMGKIEPGDIMVTMDVSSLYTNIDNIEGIHAIRENESIKSNFANSTIDMICTLMNIVLTLNNFIFNGQNYHQTKGTAMGTRAAPNYANLFMGWFEDKHIYQTEWNKHIRYYGRFIDDIMLIWKGTENELKEFLIYINQVHSSIKFTSESSMSKINFLDLTISKDQRGYLAIDIYQKPTDTHNYLQRNSAHPHHCKKSIPHSQFLRLKRLITDKETLKRRLHEYIEYFVNSGYSRKKLQEQARAILTPSEKEVTEKEKPSNIKFVTTYNTTLPQVKTLIRKHWGITQTNIKCRSALKSVPQVVFKRNKNLSDHLVRAKYRTGEPKGVFFTEKEVRRCKRCSWCNNLTEGSQFHSYHTKNEYKIFHQMNCCSQWVIYLCECTKHKKQYVGKSEGKLNIRMNNNRYHLKIRYIACMLVKHFLESPNCNMEDNLRIMPIEQLKCWDKPDRVVEKKRMLRDREIFWQKKLNTYAPHGLNKREG